MSDHDYDLCLKVDKTLDVSNFKSVTANINISTNNNSNFKAVTSIDISANNDIDFSTNNSNKPLNTFQVMMRSRKLRLNTFNFVESARLELKTLVCDIVSVNSLSKDIISVNSLPKNGVSVNSLSKDIVSVNTLSKKGVSVNSLSPDGCRLVGLRDSVCMNEIECVCYTPRDLKLLVEPMSILCNVLSEDVESIEKAILKQPYGRHAGFYNLIKIFLDQQPSKFNHFTQHEKDPHFRCDIKYIGSQSEILPPYLSFSCL